MKLLDPIHRFYALISGIAARWLKEELATHGVRVRLSEGCLTELLRHADATAWRLASGGDIPYLSHLRQSLAATAGFIELWTESDVKVSPDDETGELVRIARNFALPRRWRLSDPAVAACRSTQFSHWKWASGLEATPLPQP
jgi:hypothetical protein